MKILYLTTESISQSPIISSQVLPLLENNALQAQCTLVIFEPNAVKYSVEQYSEVITVACFRKRSQILNLLNLSLWLIWNAKSFDIVHVRSYLPMIPALLCKIFGSVRCLIFDPRGLFADELLYYDGRKNIAKVFKLLEKIFLLRSDAVVAVSKAMKKYYVENCHVDPKKIQVIPTFAQQALSGTPAHIPDIRSIKGWQEKVILCYSGSMEGWQCFDEVVNIFCGAIAASDKFRFLFMSKSQSDMRSRLHNRLPSESYVVLSATPSELSYYLGQCDYGFLIRKPHLINIVAAPIKIKDYLLAGLLLVVTEGVGDTSQYITENGCGLTLSYDDIVSRRINYKEISSIISADEKNSIASQAAHNFSLSVSVTQYQNLYKKLLSSTFQFASGVKGP